MKKITFNSLSKSFITLLFLAVIGISANVNAATYYVKTNGSTAWGSLTGSPTIVELAAGNTITGFATINGSADGTSIYYFAPGTYNINFTFEITTGKVYGGFSGNETSTADLTTRVTSDLDLNGIVEPWEFTNVVTFTASVNNGSYSGGGTARATRLMTISGTGGEANGITLFDFYCKTTTAQDGVIVLGDLTLGNTAASYSGKLTQCIVRQIKNFASTTVPNHGIVMLTNASSTVDKCLIEDCRIPNGSGTVYMNKNGGTVSNSVIRNNYVLNNTNGGGYGGGIWLAGSPATTVDAIVSNCVVYNNTGTAGGAIRGQAANATSKGIQIVNCTVVNNSTGSATGAASIELISSGLVANTICISDLWSEIRLHSTTNYVVNSVYGALATAGQAIYPAAASNNNTAGIADNTFTALNFKRATTFQGYTGNNVDKNTGWSAEKMAEIKAANYQITNTLSSAYTTANATLPATFKAAGGTGADIAITSNIVPATDINGETRNTIGAYNYDGTAPTVTLSSTATSPTSTSPIPITITFSENVTGFDNTDLTIGNGTASNFRATSGKTFAVDITPLVNGTVTVDIDAAKAQDGTGNNNTAATQFSISYEAAPTAPDGVTTTAVSPIGSATATSGVTVTSTGGAALTASGVIWSTSATPTISLLTKTTDGSGTISGLAQNTLYYVRAYATNAIGTTYGNELTFTTKWAITASPATADGTVSGSGDYANAATVNLTATATGVKRFMNWTIGGSVVSLNKTYSFTAAATVTVVANFADVQTTYYVRPSGSSAWGSIGATVDQIITATDAANNVNLAYLANNTADGTATYYFAAGNYTLSAGSTSLNLGKFYGGFSGSESSIDLNARATSDLDGNGLIEPWEMTNATVLQGREVLKYEQAGVSNGERLISIDNSAEVNGVTLTDFNYLSYSGPIGVGTPTTNPADDADAKKGFLKRCIVRKIKSARGVVMLSNSKSIVDQCLIEDCFGTTSYGAVYFNRYGGTLSNSVVRNNFATTEGGAIYAGNATTTTDLKAIVKNCLIYNNEATTKGGAISSKSISSSFGGIEIVNSTIANNKTGATGNASVEIEGTGLIVNSIITGDTKADLFAATSAVTNLNGVVYNTLASGSAALTTSNTVSGQAYTALNFASPTSTPGYLGLTVDATYTAMRAAKFTVTNVNSPAVTTPEGSVATYSGINVYASVPTTDITSLTRTGAKTLGAYQATHSVASGVTETISQPTTLASLTVAAGGKLTINSGIAASVGSLTLESDADGTATMINSGTFTGTVIAKQYLGSARNWYVSSPVSNAPSPSSSMDYYYEYVEAGSNNPTGQPGSSTVYWKGLANGTTMEVGKGYIAKSNAGTTVQFSGTPNNGNITTVFDLTRNDAQGKGFNLVGNPYPSYIDWSLVAAANSTLSNTFYFRSKNTNVTSTYTFVTYNGLLNTSVSSNGTANTTTTRFIPPTQAFWVRVNSGTATTKMNFNNDMRSHLDASGNLLKAPKVDNRTRLRLQLINGSEGDETLICTDANAENGFDVYDSPKMMNNSNITPDLYTKAGAERLVINGLNTITDNMELPLGFSLNAAASLKLKATEMSNFPVGTRIYLLDKVDNVETELQPETTYSFSTTAATLNNESRFSLLFRAPGSITDIENATKLNAQVFVNANNQITIIAPEKANYSIYNSMGQLIENGNLNSRHETSNIKLAAGVYVVKVGNQSKRVVAP